MWCSIFFMRGRLLRKKSNSAQKGKKFQLTIEKTIDKYSMSLKIFRKMTIFLMRELLSERLNKKTLFFNIFTLIAMAGP